MKLGTVALVVMIICDVIVLGNIVFHQWDAAILFCLMAWRLDGVARRNR